MQFFPQKPWSLGQVVEAVFPTGERRPMIAIGTESLSPIPVEYATYTLQDPIVTTKDFIINRRSVLQVAPDSVDFEVNFDLIAADLGLPLRTGLGAEPIVIEPTYVWTIEKVGGGYSQTYSKPQSILNAWRNGNRKTGPFVVHMFEEHGDFTVSCVAHYINQTTGALISCVSDPVTITVNDPDVIYPGTNTIAISDDTDFSFAPTGAIQLTETNIRNGDAWWTDQRNGTPKRLLLKPGGNFLMSLSLLEGDNPHYWIGARQGEAKPQLDASVMQNSINGITGRKIAFYILNNYTGFRSGLPVDFRLNNMQFDGNYDPVTTEPGSYDRGLVSDRFFWSLKSTNTCFNDLTIDGFGATNIETASVDVSPTQLDAPDRFHVHDTRVTNFGGQYGAFYQSPSLNNNSYVALTGFDYRQPQNVPRRAGSPARAVRINDADRIYVGGVYGFSPDFDNSLIKLNDTMQSERAQIVTVDGWAGEGMNNMMRIAGNNATTAGVDASTINISMDGLMFLAHHGAEVLIESFANGAVIRNMIAWIPDVQSGSIRSFRRVLSFAGSAGTRAFSPNFDQNAIFEFRNITLINDRTVSNNQGTTPTVFITSETDTISPTFKNSIAVGVGGWNAGSFTFNNSATLSTTPIVMSPNTNDYLDENAVSDPTKATDANAAYRAGTTDQSVRATYFDAERDVRSVTSTDGWVE